MAAVTESFWRTVRALDAAIEASPPADARLLELLATAEGAIPATVPADAFFAYLGERYPGGAVLDYLDGLDAAELYLVAACDRGDPAALARFDRDYLAEVRVGAARLGCSADELDEITQEVRRMLLVPRADGRPGVATMTARGDLRALIRLMAVRAGISLRRKGGRLVLGDSSAILDVAVDDGGTPSVALARAEHRDLLGRALEAALGTLDARTRTALKLHCLDGVPLAAVATMYKVDRSTVTRWIARARETVLVETRRQLAAAGIEPAGFESFVDVVRSNFALSLRRMLS